jgi:hypothetical protein
MVSAPIIERATGRPADRVPHRGGGRPRGPRPSTVVALGLVALTIVVGATSAIAAQSAKPRPTVVTGAGDIRPTVDRYRSLLGPDNGGGPDRHTSGRREISWDSVPDQFAEPNALPPDFFNAATAPRARGAVLQTPGDRVAVSARLGNPAGVPVRFGDINPTYTARFRTFSPERLFSPIGSNVVNLRFYVPGTTQPAAVRGFGAVYTDVELKETAAFEFFDVQGRSLGRFPVPVSKNGLSFLGVAYPSAIVGRVRIVYGNSKLGPNDSKRYDVAVMDDFIYGEPQPR